MKNVFLYTVGILKANKIVRLVFAQFITIFYSNTTKRHRNFPILYFRNKTKIARGTIYILSLVIKENSSFWMRMFFFLFFFQNDYYYLVLNKDCLTNSIIWEISKYKLCISNKWGYYWLFHHSLQLFLSFWFYSHIVLSLYH